MAGAGGVYVGGGATVVMDPPPVVYVKVFHTGSGPDRHLRMKANEVAIMARSLAPKRTGRLASTIEVAQNRDEKGRYSFGYAVSAGTSYGYYVHEGTGPSPRWPDSRKVMHFRGSRDHANLYRDFVMHPGTPAQPFLQDALIAMVGG
jgi:hypothetical protein